MPQGEPTLRSNIHEHQATTPQSPEMHEEPKKSPESQGSSRGPEDDRTQGKIGPSAG